MPMAAFGAVLAAFWLYVTLASVVGRVPVIVRPAVWMAAIATATGAEVVALMLTPMQGLDVVMWVLVVAASAVTAVAPLRGVVQFYGVGEQAFIDSLRCALDDLGWGYDLRVDGRQRVDRVLLRGVYTGLVFRVRVRDGQAWLGTRDGVLARHRMAEVADAMEAQLWGDEAVASLGSRAVSAFAPVVFVCAIVLFVL